MRTRQLWCFLTAVLVLLLFSFASYGAGRPFITRWKGEAGRKLRIPINEFNDSYVGYKIVIKKASDGSVLVTKNILYNSSFIYTPTEDGELLVEAGPNGVTSFRTSDDNAECLLRVEQFGTVKWTSISFRGSKNLQFAEGIDTPDLSKVTNMDDMFSGCTSFNQPLNSWDVSKVTSMSGMFAGCSSFNQSLSSWNVSRVTSMRGMFSCCTSFNQPLNNWDVSKAFSMENMFFGCTSFNQDLGMWKLESCNQLGLDDCGMSAENYSKSLIGWAAQDDIHSDLQLGAEGSKYFLEATTARNTLIRSKHWTISGDMLLALTFGTKKISLIKGVEHMLELTKEGIDKSETVTIASSDPTIVQIVDVASSIKIKGIRGGTATITATVAANGSHGELIDKCEVTVIVPVTGVTLSQTELPLVKGASAELTATVSPADATNKNVTWSSNNKTVATVENGTVTAVSGGNATITVTTEDGNHTASCEVFVTVPITGVTLLQTELSLVKGASAELTAIVSPADATNKNVTWSSNNSSVATVENGTVTAVSGGHATITVTTEDGNYTASCSVTVEAATAVADAVFASVHVSPNPFGAQLRIANGDLRGQYALYNAQGVVVASGVLEDGETRINTASFSAGVYLLRLTAENGAAKTLTVVKD